MPATLTTGAAARILGVSVDTLRAWGARYPEIVAGERRAGQYRRYERRMVLALRDALREGLGGVAMVERALELRASYDAPPDIRARLGSMESKLDRILLMLARIERRAD